MIGSGRAMALEAGSACHEVFAAVRLFDLIEYGSKVYDEVDVVNLAAKRAHQLFDENVGEGVIDTSRTDEMLTLFADKSEDERTRVLRGALHILETSGFYDDPFDKRRTMDKLTEACIAYIDRYDFGKNVPYVNGEFVGVENAFDLVVEYEVDELSQVDDAYKRRVRFTGRIDGVHCFRNDPQYPIIEENKTASRLGDAWEQSFEMSHQVTGYMVAASTITGLNIRQARIRGLAIPQPRIHDGGGVVAVTAFRQDHQLVTWADWFMHTVEQYFRWRDDPLSAPRYTHSCNRYFRPCSFIPLCAASPEEGREILEEMVIDEWSPLHEKSGD